MRSSEGQYWIALDHVRAIAALLVFSWHFVHGADGQPIPFAGAPALFPLALLDEGHTGVAVFMTLSGYLFAKILDGRDVSYGRFFWNRLLRLAPLLLVTKLIAATILWRHGGDVAAFWRGQLKGLILPTWLDGGWSVMVEVHFYLLLPYLMLLFRRDARWLLAPLLLAIGLRATLFALDVDVQYWAYYTIVGRIDQFLAGMICFAYRGRIARSGRGVALGAVAFGLFYWGFDVAGGYYHLADHGRGAAALWVVLPTIEGIAYAAAIAYYDTRPRVPDGPLARSWARIGAVSYSIYLFHFFLFRPMMEAVAATLRPPQNLYVWLALAFLAFLALYPLSWASFRFIEAPFLKLRVRYTRPTASAA